MQVSEQFALLSLEQRRLVLDVWEAEPEMGYLFELAARDQNYPGYDRELDYQRFKQGIRYLVGYDARNSAVASPEHYEACLTFIDRLLPENVVAPVEYEATV